MCQQASLDLPADLRSASLARVFVGTHCQTWGLPEVADAALLGASELVTNAVRHAGSGAEVVVTLHSASVEIAVRDTDPWPLAAPTDRVQLHAAPDEPVPSMLAEGGRGLLLIDQLPGEWGVAPLTDGKAVWFRLPAPPRWRPAQPCLCAEAAPPATLGGAPFQPWL